MTCYGKIESSDNNSQAETKINPVTPPELINDIHKFESGFAHLCANKASDMTLICFGENE